MFDDCYDFRIYTIEGNIPLDDYLRMVKDKEIVFEIPKFGPDGMLIDEDEGLF